MSGHSFNDTCPECGSEIMMCSSDHKPYNMVSGECLDCGFCYYTKTEQLSLNDVNNRRDDLEMEHIKHLKNKTERS